MVARKCRAAVCWRTVREKRIANKCIDERLGRMEQGTFSWEQRQVERPTRPIEQGGLGELIGGRTPDRNGRPNGRVHD